MLVIRADRLINAIIHYSAITAFAGSVSLSITAVAWHVKRERESEVLDGCRQKIQSILNNLLEKTLDYSAGLALLRDILQNGNRRMVEQVLFEPSVSRKFLPLLQRLAADLDLVRTWQSRLNQPVCDTVNRFALYRQRLLERLPLFGFLGRASHADRLGRLRHRASWQVLIQALNDRNGDVQAAALRSLASIQDPESFPFLIERVRAASSRLALSDRELAAALAQFPPKVAPELLSLLHETDPRLRHLAVTVLREMVRQQTKSRKQPFPCANQFSSEVRDWVLTRLPEDTNANVRAGAADLLGYLIPQNEAREGLVRLMRDEIWYVRLHAVRSAGKHLFDEFVLPVSACLTDSQWRVREAAASVLASGGKAGVRHLFHILLTTQDAYAREQIVERLEVSGVIADMIAVYGKAGHELETRTLDAISGMRRTDLLQVSVSNRIKSQERNGESVACGIKDRRPLPFSPKRALAENGHRLNK
ncbi:MAG TPA: HEAT repeat domain-containing protein [Terriglobia bacterium]|nr:HEAT repeat domain-containing protein [Terriglobia bacterium]